MMVSHHHKDTHDKQSSRYASSFFGLSLKKKKSRDSLTSTIHDNSSHSQRPHSPRANSRGSGSSTEISDLEHHHHHHHHHNNDTHSTAATSVTSPVSDKNHLHDQPKKDKEEHGHSMLELKRFFKTTSLKFSSQSSLSKRSSSSTVNLSSDHDPFNEDGALAKKYGNMGKILGSGAGGSVRLLTRPSDGVTFAVKEFRARRPNEEMKEYVKKCTSEFSVGSTLHHPNIIKTLDIAHFDDRYYEIMEYCPIDFFAVVMSGKMNRGEINCCFKQMVEGVRYLHSMGLAHRDLKLDNCVVTSHGILKLIDFGSAVVFKFPYEDQIVKARGIVGSDPYMAPEVYSPIKYDPQPVDLWSLAIIYCCMTIKRFPWKAPKQNDKSFKLYCLPDDRPHDYAQAARIHRELQIKRREDKLRAEDPNYFTRSQPINNNSTNDFVEKVTEVLDNVAIDDKSKPQTEKLAQEKPSQQRGDSVSSNVQENTRPAHNNVGQSEASLSQTIKRLEQRPKEDNHTVHGPYRLMRLLPHAARPIISKLLRVDPQERATMSDIYNDEWFNDIKNCTEDSNGNPINHPGHAHTFVKEEDAHLETYREKK